MPSEFSLQIGDTIAQVNEVRRALGHDPIYELPNARQGDAAACLYWKALADCGATGVYGDRIAMASERQAQLAAQLWGTRASGCEVVPPKQMRRTISDFDEGKFGYYNEPR